MVQKHVQAVHRKEKPFECDICQTRLVGGLHIKCQICHIYYFYNFTIDSSHLTVSHPHHQVLPEVAHAETRDDRSHEGEAVQMQGVHLSDRHLRHSQQAHLVSPQGEFASICQFTNQYLPK